MSTARFESVDDYFASLDPPKAKTLRSIVDLILGGFPDLEVKQSWNVPQIHRGDDYVFGVSALKDHLSLAPWSEQVMSDFQARLEADGYLVKKNLFQVPIGWKIDEQLVCDLVEGRLAELE